MTGRLCAFRFVQRASEKNPSREPRDASFLEKLLPEGSVFSACGWKLRLGEEPYETQWILWNVTVLSVATLEDRRWWDMRELIKAALDMGDAGRISKGGVVDNCYEVCTVGTEVDTLNLWEESVDEAIRNGSDVVRTASFALLRTFVL
jgi:hypothetical protein